MTARPSRRAARPAGPVTATTDQLTGMWTPAATDPTGAAGRPEATTPPTGASSTTVGGPPVRTRPGGATRASRRVTTQPAPGSDPSPTPEPARHGDGENDDRLLRDRPPHWG
jgi:hypothetical protein